MTAAPTATCCSTCCGQMFHRKRPSPVTGHRSPVILSTPGHYFVIDGYDPSNGAYHVGQSGKVYRGGSEWMSPAQIEAAAGSPNGALFTDHPLVGGDRQVLPPIQVEGQRQVLPPLQVAGQQRQVLP